MRKPKFLKKLAVLVTAGSMALSLTACGGMTLEKLITKMDTALKDKELYQATMALELDMSMTAEDETQDISADLEMDIKTSTEPAALYMDIDIDADVAGESTKETIQIYVQEEDDTMVGYLHMDTLDTWMPFDMDMTPEEFNSTEETEETAMELPADLVLAEETQIVENRESYVLSCTITGEELMEESEEALAEAQDSLSELGLEDFNLDLSSITIPASVYVDVETYLPIRIEMELQGLSEFIDSLIDGVMDTMMSGLTGLEGMEDLDVDMSELEAEMDAADMDIEVSTAKVVLNNLGFDPVEVPTVSEEGKEAAALQEIIANQYAFEADQGDGTYVIQESGNAVKVSLPEGLTTFDYGYNYVLASTDDGMQEVSYMMYTDMTSEDFTYYVEEIYVPSYDDEGIYVSHGKGPAINGFETMYIECIGGAKVYFAWAPVGDAWIDIEIYDYDGGKLENTITPILEAVEEYEL